MEHIDPSTRLPLSLEQVAVESLAIQTLPDLLARAQRFLTTIHAWATPAHVMCMRRDAQAEGGWRVVPELTAGQTPPGFDRFLAQLEEEAGSLTRSFLVRPADPTPGVKVRDTWVVPWSFLGASGVLVLRGVPRPYPPNLGDAIALLAQPLWSLAAAGTEPEDRIHHLESLISEARHLTDGLVAGAQDTPPAGGGAVSAALAEMEEARRALLAAQGERDESRSERDHARQTLDEARADALKAQAERDEAAAESNRLRQSLAGVENERDQARSEAESLRADIEKLRSETEQLRAEAERLQAEAGKPSPTQETGEREEALAERDRARQALTEAESERDQARKQAEEARSERDRIRAESERAAEELRALNQRAKELETKAAGEGSEAADVLAAVQRERDEVKKAFAESQVERDRIREERDKTLEEAKALRSRIETLESEASAVRAKAEEDRARAEAAEKTRADAEAEREFAKGEASSLRGEIETSGQRITEAEDGRKQIQQKLDTLETEKGAAIAERDRLQVQVNQLWSSIESFQRDLKGERDHIQAERAAMEASRKTSEKIAEETAQRAAIAERERDEWRTLHTGTVEAFRDALKAARRTPFAPPTLRMAMAEAEKLLESDAVDRRAWPRALFLDRDSLGLERLAAELEASGIEAVIANYPEEVSFYLKTPDARGLTAIICDVMAFRPDHNLSEMFKLWRQDAPGVAFLLSFRADNATEAERAQRVPSTLTAGYLPRPIQRDVLTDAVHGASRRLGGHKRG